MCGKVKVNSMILLIENELAATKGPRMEAAAKKGPGIDVIPATEGHLMIVVAKKGPLVAVFTEGPMVDNTATTGEPVDDDAVATTEGPLVATTISKGPMDKAAATKGPVLDKIPTNKPAPVFTFGSTDIRLRSGVSSTATAPVKKTRGPTRPGMKKLGVKSRSRQATGLTAWLGSPGPRSTSHEVPATPTAALATGTMETLSQARPEAARVGAGTNDGDPATHPAVLATGAKATLPQARPGTADVGAGTTMVDLVSLTASPGQAGPTLGKVQTTTSDHDDTQGCLSNAPGQPVTTIGRD